MAETIGTAYIQIEPSAQGIAGSISSIVDPEASAAGKSAGGLLSSALGGAAAVGIAAVAGGTAAMGAFGKSAVDAGMSFDAAMSQVAATSQKSLDELNSEVNTTTVGTEQFTGTLREFAQYLGSTTAFSATQSAEALNYMALAGYDAQKSMDMLPKVLDLAAAGGMDLARASDMVTDAQSALGLNTEETELLVNQMAMTASKSNTSVSQLGDAILKIGATGRQAAGGTKELSMMLGVMADNGIKATEGGTHLRNIMLSLQQHSDKIKTLGVDVYDDKGNLRDLTVVFQELGVAMADMNDSEKTSFLTQEMFNKTDLAAVNALMGTEVSRWQELSAAIDLADGSAKEMAGTQLDNLSGDLTIMKSAFEGLQIEISDRLTPTLREFTQFGAEALSNMTEGFKENGLDGAMAALGESLSGFITKIVEMAPEIISAGMSLIGSLAQGIIENLPAIVEAAIQIISTLGQNLGESLPDLIPKIVDIMLQIVETLIDNIDLLIDAAIAIMVGLAEGLINATPKVIERIPEIIEKLINAYVENAPKLTKAALELMIQLGVGLIEAIPQVVEKLPEIVFAIVLGFSDLADEYIGIGKDIVLGIWDGIKEQWSPLIDDVVSLGKKLVSKVQSFFEIGSPSKLFNTEVGQWIPAGIAVGIEDNTDTVTSAIDGMMNDMMASASLDDINSNYSINKDVANDDSNMYGLMAKYLPMLENIGNTNVSLEGDAQQLFRMVRKENNAYKKSNGASAFA